MKFDFKYMMENISELSEEFIHANEILLTYGRSDEVVEFLKHASRSRKFEVLVAENAPNFSGHETAKCLSEFGISTTVIADCSVFALMSRVNKVIIGTHSVLANGGILGYNGACGICLAARAHSVPVLVICGVYRLSPIYPFDHQALNETTNPS
jgi:translation initiation factor eIF-2B subunit beta